MNLRILSHSLALALAPTTHAAVMKRTLATAATGDNLPRADAWRGFETGFTREGDTFVCDNDGDAKTHRGAAQAVTFDSPSLAPIVTEVWSKAGGVGGSRDGDYSIYLDLVHADGTPLWGQTAPFAVGTHDWERRQVVVLPAKPVKSVTMNLLLRKQSGKASFPGATLRRLAAEGAVCARAARAGAL